MYSKITFSYTKVGYKNSEEDGCLGMIADSIVAVLIRPKQISAENTCQEWYLESGFGPCDRQGLLFPSLEAAGIWILNQLDSDASQ